MVKGRIICMHVCMYYVVINLSLAITVTSLITYFSLCLCPVLNYHTFNFNLFSCYTDWYVLKQISFQGQLNTILFYLINGKRR